ncbi:hypothetical protein KXD40_007411 [Peronospora effusa]|uniref:RxLR effector protein n=1 Tax=Peronospora effusa TaxID=542832 RepID=A0A3R8CNH0_9STRA|nr:hypothetical protein DD237_007032 [Peronospora effusa]UIZ29015.1 hypothetical protein KXD40_007411 [Peronospora effusa]
MHLSKFFLPVTLIFIAYCSTFASAENVIQVKSLITDSQRELVDESHRNLREGVAEDDMKPEEEDESEERGYAFGRRQIVATVDDLVRTMRMSVKDLKHFIELSKKLETMTMRFKV